MGGTSGICNDWGLSFPTKDHNVCTFVLVGRTGNGKSSTGNTILGKNAFLSKRSPGCVTITCELGNSVLENGLILNVIDTPGLCDASVEFEVIRNEIVKCIAMAKDGIHAVLVVLSVRARFSREEESVIKSLREIFGTNINEYMIIVFTCGDDLEDDGVTLDDFLCGCDCPGALKEMLRMCGDRCVLFDNRTKNASKKSQQLEELLYLVDVVGHNNGGKPFTNELFVEMKKGAGKMNGDLIAEINSSKLELSMFKKEFKKTTEMVESKLRKTTCMLEKQLAEEHVARLQLEISAKEAKEKSDKEHAAREKEIRKLREDLEMAEKSCAVLNKKFEESGCSIL